MNRQAEKSPDQGRAMILVHEVGVNDVLLGRGTGPNENQGNVRFRRLLEEMVERLQYPKSSMISKTAVATEVLQTIKERNGRFVRKLTSEERRSVLGKLSGKNKKGKNDDIFLVVAEKLALEKIRQSFRFQLNSTKSNHRRSIFAGTQKTRSSSLDELNKAKAISSSAAMERPMDATSSSSLPLPRPSPPRGNETLGGGGQPPPTLRDTAIDLPRERAAGEDLVLLPALLQMVTNYAHHYQLNAASRQNNTAMNPRDLQLSLLLQSLQRATPVLPVTPTPQPSPPLPAGDALNAMLLAYRMSRTTDENVVSLCHIAVGIEKTLALLFREGR
jgi:hypothetical protein